METKQNPYISIVVPIYHIPERYLRKCIESLREQTLREIEIILINDGSTSQNAQICDEYAKKEPKIVVIHQENQGVSVARNEGIKIAKGEWISFVDPDDWVEPDMMAKLYEMVRKNDSIDIAICSSYANYQDHEIKNSFYPKQGILTDQDKEELVLQIIGKGSQKGYPKESSIAVPWAKLYRKELLRQKNLQFVPEMKKSQDAVFNLYAIEEANQIIYEEKYLYHYRKEENSITNRYDPHMVDYYRKILQEFERFIMLYEKGKKAQEALTYRRITMIKMLSYQYFFHPKNQQNKQRKKEEFLRYCQEEYNQKAIQKAKYQESNLYDKLILFCLKHHLTEGISCLMQSKRQIKKWQKKTMESPKQEGKEMKMLILGKASCVHIVKLVNELTAYGTVYLITIKGHEEAENKIDPRVQQYVLSHRFPWGYFSNAKQLKKLVGQIDPDVIDVHFASGYGTLARKAKIKPFILTTWGSDVYRFPQKSNWHRSLIRKNLSEAEKIVSTSYAMAKVIEQLVPEVKHKISVIPFGVDPILFANRKTNQESKEVIQIGTVKALEEIYGIEEEILAMEIFVKQNYANDSFPHVCLAIYGEGKEKKRWEGLIQAKKLSSYVQLKGKIPNEKVPEALAEMDIYCVASYQESFGVSLLEAMACELPVVATATDGAKEILEDRVEGILVDTRNPEQIALAWQDLMEDGQKRKEMGKKGRKKVMKSYTLDEQIEKTIDLYGIMRKARS